MVHVAMIVPGPEVSEDSIELKVWRLSGSLDLVKIPAQHAAKCAL